jgi:hypothetical protein
MSFQDAVSAAYEGDLTIGGIVHGVVDGMIDNFRASAYRVEFTAAVVTTVACARSRLPFLPSLLIAVAGGKAARWAYESASEALESMARIELQVGAREAGDV